MGAQRSSLPSCALHNCCLFLLHKPDESSAGTTCSLCGKAWIQQHREDLVPHLTVQPAFTQLDEGIVDDVECFRDGRPPKAWEENTCCAHGSALLPFTKVAICHAWSLRALHAASQECHPSLVPTALLPATAKSSLECSQPKVVLTQFSTAEKTWEGQS